MVGIFSKTVDSNFIEAIGFSGMDFVILDQEHGPSSRENLFNHVRACKVSNVLSIARVSELNSNLIGSALDCGVDGIQVPNISSVKEAELAVEYSKFFPLGNRGVCRFVKDANHGSMDKKKYFENANAKKLIVQVEGEKGINDLESIFSVKNIDIIFIGPYDLSQSLGIPGEIDHPKMIGLMRDISQLAGENDIKLGTFADSIPTAKKMMNYGFEYLAYSVDVNIFLNSCKDIKRKILNHI